MPNKRIEAFRVADPEKDKRVKLLPEDKEEIRRRHEAGEGIRPLARSYKVSRRTIQFVCYPERLERNKEVRKDRGGWRQYYDNKKHAKYIAKHRKHKSELLEQQT